MTDRRLPRIELGFQVYGEDGGDPFGAVREVLPQGRAEIIIYVENAGDFSLPLSSVKGVHDGKVVVDIPSLDPRLRLAIGHAHEREEPKLLAARAPARGPAGARPEGGRRPARGGGLRSGRRS